jgi:hypothetical protein
MEELMFNHHKKILTMAVVAALGVSASAEAGTVTASWTGTFTMLGSNGTFTATPDSAACYPGMMFSSTECLRTFISGSITYDDAAGTGSATMTPFSFFGSGYMNIYSMSLKGIGDGMGGPEIGRAS